MTTRIDLVANLDHKIAADASLRIKLEEAAHEVQAEAKRIAKDVAYDTGDYERGIVTDFGHDSRGQGASVQATDFKSWWVEAGTSTHPPKAVLRRAAEATGLKVGPGRGGG